MKSVISLLFLLQIIIDGDLLGVVQCADFQGFRCRDDSNFTREIGHLKLEAIREALDSLPGNITNNRNFVNTTARENTDAQVTAVALCRGYIVQKACRRCVSNSIKSFPRACPQTSEAVAWYSNCMVRYSDRRFLGVLDSWTSAHETTTETVNNFVAFEMAFRNLTTRLQVEAAGGNSSLKLAVGEETYGEDMFMIYAMMQCTPDLLREQCSKCLNSTITSIQDCCHVKKAASVFFPNCFLRYSNEKFYNDATSTPSPSSSGKKDEKSNNTRLFYILVPVTCISLVLIGIGVWFHSTKRQRKDGVLPQESTGFSSFLSGHRQTSTNETVGTEIDTIKSLQYDLGTIEVATNYFSPKNKIGKGGFGSVYKGVLQNGQEVAVKRLSETSGQGVDEFVNEAVLVAKLQHRNLVRLLGFCHDANEKILIYEYVPNKSLDYFLFDPIKHGHLDWAIRWKIIGGITRGMLYLHEDSRLKIIHRDLKASNILLDQDMNAKIADFGLARTFGVDQTLESTKRIAGTIGYISPEYAMYGRYSVKSDVFAFGVIVLEIVSGQRNSNFYQPGEAADLCLYAWKQWTGGKPLKLTDPRLGESYSKEEVIRCINIGLLCVQQNADERPTMASILNMLNNNSITLPDPQQPPYFLSKEDFSDNSSKRHFSDTSGDVDKSTPSAVSLYESWISQLRPR